MSVVIVLILDVLLAIATWIIIACAWNNTVREELKVRGNLTWACLLGIVVAIANAVTIILLVDAVWGCAP
jgi:hypothetical protein